MNETRELQDLAKRSPELQRLLDEHRKLDEQTDALSRRRVRTPAEEMERKRLSKMKLASKDKIARMVAQLKN